MPPCLHSCALGPKYCGPCFGHGAPSDQSSDGCMALQTVQRRRVGVGGRTPESARPDPKLLGPSKCQQYPAWAPVGSHNHHSAFLRFAPSPSTPVDHSWSVGIRNVRHCHVAPCVVCVLGHPRLVVLAAARRPLRPTQFGHFPRKDALDAPPTSKHAQSGNRSHNLSVARPTLSPVELSGDPCVCAWVGGWVGGWKSQLLLGTSCFPL